MKQTPPKKTVYKTAPLKVSRPRLPPSVIKPLVSLQVAEAFQAGFQLGYTTAMYEMGMTKGTTAVDDISTR